jgi:hypothetical protein
MHCVCLDMAIMNVVSALCWLLGVVWQGCLVALPAPALVG